MAKIINIKNEVLVRVYMIGFLIMLFALVVIWKAIYIQVWEGAKWQKMRDDLVIADACEVKTWEPEAQLVEDGWGPAIEVFEAAQVASSKRTKAAARRAAASSRTEAAAQQSGSAASRKRNRLLKELDSTLLL